MRLTLIPAMLILAVVWSGTAFAQSSGGTSGTGGTDTTGTSGANTAGITTQLLTGETTGATGTTGTTGTETETTGFVGGNATETFIGGAREATEQQNMDRQFQAFMQEAIAPSNQSQQSGTPREIRTTMRIGFNFPSASAAQQSGKLANANSLSLARFTSTRPEFSSVNINLASDGTAILTGLSPSTESSRLAANLIRLQPGVRKVNNQIAVAR